MKRKFEIWMEGYAITGNSSGASYLGSAEAETFEEACEMVAGERLDRNSDGSYRYPYPSIWACRLYDNEADAREFFG